MSTNQANPIKTYTDVSENLDYNFNYPAQFESEIVVELYNDQDEDISHLVDYVLTMSKSSGSLYFDENTVSLTWAAAGSLPVNNKLVVYRHTIDYQQTRPASKPSFLPIIVIAILP